MIDYMLYMWIGFFVLSVAVEVVTMNLIAIWFMPGTLAAIVLALFSVPVWIQVLVFVILTVIIFLATGRFTRRMMTKKSLPTNADRVIGQQALVTETISDRLQTGQAKVLGQLWTARAENPAEDIPAGVTVRVLRIEGVKIIVIPA